MVEGDQETRTRACWRVRQVAAIGAGGKCMRVGVWGRDRRFSPTCRPSTGSPAACCCAAAMPIRSLHSTAAVAAQHAGTPSLDHWMRQGGGCGYLCGRGSGGSGLAAGRGGGDGGGGAVDEGRSTCRRSLPSGRMLRGTVRPAATPLRPVHRGRSAHSQLFNCERHGNGRATGVTISASCGDGAGAGEPAQRG